MNTFTRLIIAFIIIIFVPFAISFYVFQKTANDMTMSQISSETSNSIELVSNSIDSLLKKMASIALYVNDDESIKELIQQEIEDSDASSFSNRENKNLSKLNRINKFNGFISNMAFNMIGTRCYITIITSSGQKYTNWTYEGAGSDSYLNRYMPGNTRDKGTNLIWKGIEKNYIESETNLHPYVMTLVKNIYNASGENQYGTFVISVPEDEISKLMTAENQQQKRVILNENLDVISSTVKEWLNKPFMNVYDCIFPEEQKGYFVIDDAKGNKSIISYNTIRNWKVVDIKSYDAITEQLGKVRNQLLIINAIFILAFWGISAVIARNISKPLRKLAKLMLKTDLDSSYGDQTVKRHDEIGILEENFNTMRKNIKSLMQDNMDKERKKRDAELKSLQAQISPHFLFNTLNAVRWAAINNNAKKAADMVLALTNLLRMTIVKGDELITVEEEIENLKNYSAIFQMRHSIEFQLCCNIEEDIRQYGIPKLLLQPLVENAIIHGFEGIVTGGVIDITGMKRDGFVVLCVKDNGVGMSPDSGLRGEDTGKLKFSGIGIRNVDERIKLYFGEEYGLRLVSTEGKGTSAEVWLPEQNEKEGHSYDKDIVSR
ncbi:MAG TPA: sensor histidine kinase [Clostridia bacterium]|nr:sensor histidine kinase [Clostridia bacterium]